MKVQVKIDRSCVRFLAGAVFAGEYVLDDPFKPYLRQLNTPAGHSVTVVSPGDHRHHKGLMYGLRAADVNWWEEGPGSGGCGVQEVIRTDAVDGGIRQELLWREEGGGLHTYREQREITCVCDGTAFVWQWRTHRESLREHRLVKSEWSLPIPDGRKINYHGLGIRLPWVWAHGGDDARAFNGLDVGGEPSTPMSACGTSGPEVTWWGNIDGYWSPPVAAVTMAQAQQFSWFLIKGDFAYLAVGPSNEKELDIRTGELAEEAYNVRVEDR